MQNYLFILFVITIIAVTILLIWAVFFVIPRKIKEIRNAEKNKFKITHVDVSDDGIDIDM